MNCDKLRKITRNSVSHSHRAGKGRLGKLRSKIEDCLYTVETILTMSGPATVTASHVFAMVRAAGRHLLGAAVPLPLPVPQYILDLIQSPLRLFISDDIRRHKVKHITQRSQ
jgi:hypothetical protein